MNWAVDVYKRQVQTGAAAGRKDALRFLIAPPVHAVTPFAGPAEKRHIVAGVVGKFPVKMPDHQALHCKNTRVGVCHGDQLCQPIRFGKSVIVEQNHIGSFGQANSGVHSSGKTGVMIIFYKGVPLVPHITFGNRKTFVRRAVVHDDQFKVLLCLGPHRFDRVTMPPGSIEVGNYDARFQSVSSSVLRLHSV